jgi:hypothetical protein
MALLRAAPISAVVLFIVSVVADDEVHATAVHAAQPWRPPRPPPPPLPLTLHPLLSDNAVLQRAPERAAIYGWGERPGATVTVHFRGNAYEGTVAANDTGLGALMWRVELPPTPASTSPENITVAGLGVTVTLANVLFGDIWMCGGTICCAAQPFLQFPRPCSRRYSCLRPRIVPDTGATLSCFA